LIQEFSPKAVSNRPQAHAVGFNLSTDTLRSLTTTYLEKRTPPKETDSGAELYWTTRRCDVLVSSFDPTVLRTTGIKIVEDLWTNDISAELAVDASSLEELMVKYREHNHRWIVIAKADSKERGYKVRNLVRREEFDIRASELIPWLRSEVQARHHREGAEPRQFRQPNQQDSIQSNEKANNVRILVPQHRSKKTNRRNIVESALLSSREVADNARNGPVAAIDTRDEVLAAIRDTRLSDTESWRSVIQNAPLTERKYLSQVYDLLMDFGSEARSSERPDSYTNAFIYNYRTGSCVYYDLGCSDR
jgi:translation initiation factor 2-alpha kinase 4